MAYYTSKMKLKNKKSGTSRIEKYKKDKKNRYSSNERKKRSLLKKKNLRAKAKKIFLILLGFFALVVVIGGLFLFGYVQSLTENLPSPDKPFGNQNSASEIYDRNNKLLYRVYGNENRDVVSLNDIPVLLRWTILAAEDVDFYKHPGIDIVSIVQCGIKNIAGTSACGGSTITQQLIKQTALTNERSIERKFKEIVLAMQIEQKRNKNEILEMYLNVIPEGSNIYGLKSAAKEYFGKDMKDLNLAEMAILAAIPQNPNNMSPTRSANPNSKENAKNRQMYVLDQLEKHMNSINAQIAEQEGIENAFTKEMIEEARNYELVYSTTRKNDELKAPHFVFYVQKLLQEGKYNNGEPFSKEVIETGGLKIYTTLDLDLQQIAEEQVKEAVDVYGKRHNAHNAALIATDPKKGEILAMVGSYDYFGKSYPEGCKTNDCMFAPEVNILDTLQSYGSSMKPMVYEFAMEKGLISAGTELPDIPIKIGNYQPKNYSPTFTGIRPARIQLRDSQNIPPVYMLNTLGVKNFVNEMKKWGYTTLDDPRGYGPSIALGGADIKLVDHAQAYGVFANQGKLVKLDGILRIEDRDGKEVYTHKPEEIQVADPRAVYIINDILNANKGGPGVNASNGGREYRNWDRRDIAGKTGTSEDAKETLFATYTPEVVVIGWLGNNNNAPMTGVASGFTSARPWVSKFVLRTGSYFPPTPFSRPDGVVIKNGCEGKQEENCFASAGDLGIVNINPPSYITSLEYDVCVDQTDHLAREIDKTLGMSQKIEVKKYIMPDKSLQTFLDEYVQSKPELGGIVPTEYCNISRNPSGTFEPWAVITSPENGKIVTGELNVAYNAYTATDGAIITKTEILIDNEVVHTSTILPVSKAITLAGNHKTPGLHNLLIKVYDSKGGIGSTGTTFIVKDITPTPVVTITVSVTP